jgi:hypothetical protein
MPDPIRLLVAGANPGPAAADVAAAVQEFAPGTEITTQPVAEADDEVRRAVDPIALASLILAIPGAILAVLSLADRIRKRRDAQTLLDQVKRIEVTHRVRVYVISEQGSKSLDQMNADQLLDLVDQSDE